MTTKKWVEVSRVRTGVPGIAKRSTYRVSFAGRGLNQNWFALSASWRHLQTNLKWGSQYYSTVNVEGTDFRGNITTYGSVAPSSVKKSVSKSRALCKTRTILTPLDSGR